MQNTPQADPGTAIEAASVPAVAVARTLDEWATIVRADVTRVFDDLVAAGRHLMEAKAQHRGSFVAWLESGVLGFGKSRAYQLMAVADKLGDFQHVGNLPTDSVALYEMTRLDRPQLMEAIKTGKVTPEMDRLDAQQLVQYYRYHEERRKQLAAAPVVTMPPVAVRATSSDPQQLDVEDEDDEDEEYEPEQYEDRFTEGAILGWIATGEKSIDQIYEEMDDEDHDVLREEPDVMRAVQAFLDLGYELCKAGEGVGYRYSSASPIARLLLGQAMKWAAPWYLALANELGPEGNGPAEPPTEVAE